MVIVLVYLIEIGIILDRKNWLKSFESGWIIQHIQFHSAKPFDAFENYKNVMLEHSWMVKTGSNFGTYDPVYEALNRKSVSAASLGYNPLFPKQTKSPRE